MIIKTTEELKKYVNKLSCQEYIAIDTEFMREKTYWPQVCLIQIAGKDIAFCIDPLMEEIDLSILFDLMQNEKVVKVFHSGRQDIEIFVNLMNKVPSPIFDTQLAAMVCGLGDSISYKDLVMTLLNEDIDKGMRYTDWSKRPLDERQIEYAMSDVTHLCNVYEILQQRLSENNRTSWINEEMEVLSDINTYNIPPETAYKRLKTGGLSPKNLGILKSLAAWREIKSKETNRPRGFIMKDLLLQELVKFNPKTMEDLHKVRGISEAGKYNQEILDAIKFGQENPEKIKIPSRKKVSKPLMDMLKMLLHIKSEEYGVAAKLIATTDDLEKIATGDKEVKSLKGWRKEVFGASAIDLKKGKTAVSYNPKENKITLHEI